MVAPEQRPVHLGRAEDPRQPGVQVEVAEVPPSVEVPPEGAWVPLTPEGELPALWVAPVGTPVPAEWAQREALAQGEFPPGQVGLWQMNPPDPAGLALPELPLAEMGQRWAAQVREAMARPVPVVPSPAVQELRVVLERLAQQVGAQLAALVADLQRAAAQVWAQVAPQVGELTRHLAGLAAQMEALEEVLEPELDLGVDPRLAQPEELGMAGLAGVLAPRNQEARPEAFLARAEEVLAQQEELRAAYREQADLEEAPPWADPDHPVLADLAEAGRHWASLVDSGQADLVGEADQVAFLRQVAADLANRGEWHPGAAANLAALLEADQEARQGVPAQAVTPADPVPEAYRRGAGERPAESPGQEADRLFGRPLAPGLVVVQRRGADPVVRYPSGAELDLPGAHLVELQVQAHPGLSPAQQAVYRDLLAAARQLELDQAGEDRRARHLRQHFLAGQVCQDPGALLRGLPGV